MTPASSTARSARAPQRIRFGVARRCVCAALGCTAALVKPIRPFQSPAPDAPVLLLEPFGMGDVISLEPLVRELLRQGREVRFCARATWRELYPSVPAAHWVDARIPWTSYDERGKYSFRALCSAEFREFRGALREAASGAIGLDTRGDPRSILLLRLAGCRDVLSLSHYLGSDFRNVAAAAPQVEFADDLKRWELNLRFLPPLGLKPADTVAPPRFTHLAEAREPMRGRIGFIPVAPWSGKHWSHERWLELNRRLRVEGRETLGLCGPNQAAVARAELGDTVEIRECNSLAEWARALAACAQVVAVDTGPTHLADALGVPTLALFGQGKLPLWSPSGPRSRALHHQADADFVLCHPLVKNASLGRKFMERITVQEVLEAVRNISSTPETT